MNILFITRISPFPVNNGEKIRSLGLLYCLQSSGHKVTAITTDTGQLGDDGCFVTGVRFIAHKFNVGCRAVPFFRDRGLVKKINRVLSDGDVDLAVLDYQYLGQYIAFFHKKNIPVIYGTHNAQASLDAQRVPTRGWLLKLPQLLYAAAGWIHERAFFNKADALWVTSDEDAHYHSKFVKGFRIVLLPNFLIAAKYPVKPVEKQNTIVITASFNSFQNEAGLAWFLENVWDAELAGMTELLLVGKESDVALDRFRCQGFFAEGVSATGRVDSVNQYVATARLSIVPLLHGSGTRLKIVEALALGTPVISTTVGAAGIKREIIHIADTPADFKEMIIKCLQRPADDHEKLRQAFCENYSSDRAVEIIKKTIASVLPK
jgi:glycosyltransferase involved in cell wall biosynthesis